MINIPYPQTLGKKKMSAEAFAAGHQLHAGAVR